MPPGDDDEAAARAALSAIAGEELAASDLPRSPYYPTRDELAKLGRDLSALYADSWRAWLDRIFTRARAERAQTGPAARVAPAAPPRAELVAELERRRPDATRSPALMAILADETILVALVDAVTVVDDAAARLVAPTPLP